MITNDKILEINSNDTPSVHLRPDGRYLAYSQPGRAPMIGVYGSSEADAINIYNDRVKAWIRSISEGSILD